MNEQPNTAPWPEGVSLRFGTLLGATVDLRAHTHEDHMGVTVEGASAACNGCGDGQSRDQLPRVRGWAQTHAAMCRGLPKPGVTQ